MKTISLLAVLAAASFASAQDYSGTLVYDFKTHDTALGITKTFTTLNDTFGIKGLKIDLDGFVGSSLNGGKPVGAILLMASAKAADRATITFGPGFTFQDSRPVGFVIAGGVSVRF